MKTSADKSTTTTSVTATQTSQQPFFAKAGGGDFFAPAIQTKMTVNKPGDKFEQEADKMSEKVMRMPTPAPPPKEEKLQRQPDDKLQKKAEEKLQKAPQPLEKIQKKQEEKLQKAALPEEKLQKKQDEKLQKAPMPEEKVQRKAAAGAPAVSGNVQSAIHSKTTGGQPLSADVRSYMEPRFNADFSNIRVHTDAESASLNNDLSARAFTYQNHVFFSRNQYQPGTSEGKQLLAHELTHTIQQGHAIQRSPQVTTTTTPPPIQRFGLDDALDYFADKAYHIPGFRMLTIVLGFNPINMQSADRSAANILRALIELIPGGHFITQALDNHGVFNKAGTWVEQKLAELGDIGSDIAAALRAFLDSLSWTDIFDLGGVWDRAKRIFTDPIARLISFAGSVVSEILKMVKDAILKPLAAMAEGTRGYDLLKALLGEDPITGEPVPRTADTLIGGFMKLIGQEEIWENLKKGNAVARAWAWFQGALSGLLSFARAIPRRIIDTITSLTFQDIVTVVGAFGKIVGAFANIAGDFFSWALNQVISLLEILFSVVAPGVMPYIKKAQAAFITILKNPVAFVGNLVRAGKRGFELFAGNILNHLKAALIRWITGPLGEAGVYIPQSFSLVEIIKLVLSVFGLTWQNIRAKLVRIIPEPVLVVLERTASVLVTLVTQGPVAAWEQIKAELTELKDQMIAQITQMVTVEVVKAAVMKLVSMINPAGAVVQAIIAIYNTVTFFISKISQIAATVAAFIDSIAAIAAGQVEPAAKKVEMTMANTLTLIISFLARLVGLGNIPEKIVGIIRRLRQPIDRGLDRIVAWLGNMLRRIGSAVRQAVTSFFAPKTFSVRGESHRLYPDPDGNVMLASTPARLTNALNARRTGASADTVAKINQATALGVNLGTLNAQINAQTDPAIKANLNTQAESISNQIVALMVQIMYGTGGSATMPLAVVNFVLEGNVNEFRRQIQMQQAALRLMKVGDWQRNRARFVAFGRDTRSDTDTSRRAAMVDRLMNNPVAAVEALARDGLLTTADQAIVNSILTDKNIPDKPQALNSIARQIMASYGSRRLAVLHTVDQVAGGSATTYGDEATIFGSTDVNTAIGRQWRTRIGTVDAAAQNVDPNANVNVDLIV